MLVKTRGLKVRDGEHYTMNDKVRKVYDHKFDERGYKFRVLEYIHENHPVELMEIERNVEKGGLWTEDDDLHALESLQAAKLVEQYREDGEIYLAPVRWRGRLERPDGEFVDTGPVV